MTSPLPMDELDELEERANHPTCFKMTLDPDEVKALIAAARRSIAAVDLLSEARPRLLAAGWDSHSTIIERINGLLGNTAFPPPPTEASEERKKDTMSNVEQDARRYRRLQVLGCAPYSSASLDKGTVLRFGTLDDFVDDDLQIHPSRGEAFPVAAQSEERKEDGSANSTLVVAERHMEPAASADRGSAVASPGAANQGMGATEEVAPPPSESGDAVHVADPHTITQDERWPETQRRIDNYLEPQPTPPSSDVPPPLESGECDHYFTQDGVCIYCHALKPSPPSSDVAGMVERLEAFMAKGPPGADWGPVREAAALLEAKERAYQEEYAIVDRVWKALGITEYEQAQGKAIDELVRDLAALLERQERDLEFVKRAAYGEVDNLKAELTALREREQKLVEALEKISSAYNGACMADPSQTNSLTAEMVRYARAALQEGQKP